MAYTRPGVWVSESPLRATAPRPSTASTAAFLGTADRGPTTPYLVDSWAAFSSNFGGLSQSHDLGYAVYHYFANGGRIAYVTRVAGANATAASTTGVSYYATNVAASASLFSAYAKNPGTWANTLALVVSAGRQTATASVIPTFNLQITLNGVEVEAWNELSADINSSRYAPAVINGYSTYIEIDESSVASVTADAGFSYVLNSSTMSNGANGSAVGDSDYVTALSTLGQIEESLLINCVGQSSSTVVDAATTTAETRGNSFVIVDPDPSATSAAAINSIVNGYNASGYCAVYYPMLKMVDPMKTGPAAIRTTYPGGAIAGAYARTDAQRTVAKTPAGYDVDLRNTLGLASNMTDAIVGAVYDNGVNCLKAIPGAGVVILGGRTLQPIKPDKYISVRRSINYVKQNASDLSRNAVFEPNSPILWASLKSNINKFLTTFWGQGGLKGASPSQAFYVICDETNNTASTIENGEVHIEIGVALQYPAEFIVINVAQWTGGSNTAENI